MNDQFVNMVNNEQSKFLPLEIKSALQYLPWIELQQTTNVYLARLSRALITLIAFRPSMEFWTEITPTLSLCLFRIRLNLAFRNLLQVKKSLSIPLRPRKVLPRKYPCIVNAKGSEHGVSHVVAHVLKLR